MRRRRTRNPTEALVERLRGNGVEGCRAELLQLLTSPGRHAAAAAGGAAPLAARRRASRAAAGRRRPPPRRRRRRRRRHHRPSLPSRLWVNPIHRRRARHRRTRQAARRLKPRRPLPRLVQAR